MCSTASPSLPLGPTNTPKETHGDVPGFPSYAQYKLIEAVHLLNLSTQSRQDKSLIPQAVVDRVWDVLQVGRGVKSKSRPADVSAQDEAAFRHWARLNFTLGHPSSSVSQPNNSVSATKLTVLSQGLRVAVREQLYPLLCHAHAQTGHGGRDRTTAFLHARYRFVPKKIVHAFVRACPTCVATRSQARQETMQRKRQTQAAAEAEVDFQEWAALAMAAASAQPALLPRADTDTPGTADKENASDSLSRELLKILNTPAVREPFNTASSPRDPFTATPFLPDPGTHDYDSDYMPGRPFDSGAANAKAGVLSNQHTARPLSDHALTAPQDRILTLSELINYQASEGADASSVLAAAAVSGGKSKSSPPECVEADSFSPSSSAGSLDWAWAASASTSSSSFSDMAEMSSSSSSSSASSVVHLPSSSSSSAPTLSSSPSCSSLFDMDMDDDAVSCSFPVGDVSSPSGSVTDIVEMSSVAGMALAPPADVNADAAMDDAAPSPVSSPSLFLTPPPASVPASMSTSRTTSTPAPSSASTSTSTSIPTSASTSTPPSTPSCPPRPSVCSQSLTSASASRSPSPPPLFSPPSPSAVSLRSPSLLSASRTPRTVGIHRTHPYKVAERTHRAGCAETQEQTVSSALQTQDPPPLAASASASVSPSFSPAPPSRVAHSRRVGGVEV